MSFVTEGRRTVVITGVHVPACLNGPCEREHLHKGDCRYPEGYVPDDVEVATIKPKKRFRLLLKVIGRDAAQ